MDTSQYEKKKQKEKDWHLQRASSRPTLIQRILKSKLIFNQVRILFPYDDAKKQMARQIKVVCPESVDKLLIAPCGTGDDVPYLLPFAKEVHGIDLSSKAVSSCDPEMIAKVGDILQSGYEEESFDIIVSPLVFHHFLNFGFDPFLGEFHRLLKPQGLLVILEPSLWYPLNLITRPIKWLFNNPFGEVEDEAPFPPKLMARALKRQGFQNVSTRGATFSHPAIPIPLAKAIIFLSRPLLGLWPFKHLAWLVLSFGRKALK